MPYTLIMFPDPLTASCQLRTDAGVVIQGAPVTHPSGRPGVGFFLPDDTPQGNGIELNYSAPGKAPRSDRGILWLNAPGWQDRYPWTAGQTAAFALDDVNLSTPVSLPRLVRRGRFIAQDTGAYWTAIEATDFNILNRLTNGERISNLLEQRASIGFNLLRVFTVYDVPGIGQSPVRDDLYSAMPELIAQAATYGLYIEFVGLTGPYPAGFDKPLHWWRLCDATRGFSGLRELINEGDNPPQAGWGSPNDYYRPLDALNSAGSGTEDHNPMQPYWDGLTYRPGGGGEWQRKVGHNAMEYADATGLPTWSNETTRCPDNDSNPVHFFDAAAASTLLCAGACFHSVQGKDSTMFTGDNLACAQSWVAGARSVPLRYQDGAYSHRGDLEGGNVIRAYQRDLGGDACVVTIRA